MSKANDKQTKDQQSKQQERGPISLAPLDFEDALSGLIQAGPHPKEPKSTKGQDETPPPKRKRRKSADSPTNP